MPVVGKILMTGLLEVKVVEPLGDKLLRYKKNPQLRATFPRGIILLANGSKHWNSDLSREEALNKTAEERNLGVFMCT